MKFGKLKIFVGIAIIAFLLTTGSIILFGKLMYNRETENVSLNDSETLFLGSDSNNSGTVNMTREVDDTSSSDDVSADDGATTAAEPPVVVHETTNTRAS